MTTRLFLIALAIVSLPGFLGQTVAAADDVEIRIGPGAFTLHPIGPTDWQHQQRITLAIKNRTGRPRAIRPVLRLLVSAPALAKEGDD